MMRSTLRTGAGLLTLALSATLLGCGNSTPTGDSGSRDMAVTWRLRVATSSAGSVLLDISGTEGDPIVLHPGDMFSRVLGGTSSRVLLAGDLTGTDLLEVRGSAPGVEPTVTVLSAAEGAESGFSQIPPGDLEVEWQPVP